MNAIKTRSMRSLSVLLLLLFSIFNLTAQSTATDRKDTTSSRDTAKVELPTSMARSVSEDLIKSVIHPSPQSAAYARYGEYPVDYSTGVPKIEIPLYTLNTGDYQLPISISYHASGIKVTDVSTPVGLGWVLTAGGVISRSSRAVSDRLNNPEGKDVWEINSQGKIVNHIEDQTQDAFYMLDRNGNKIDGKEISLKYRTVEKYSVNIYDKKDYISMFVVRGDNEGKELFEFFAKNTEVEWSRAAMGEKGSFGLNFLTSSHNKDYDAGMSFLVEKQLRYGYTGRIFDHSHPNNNPSPSGMTGDNGDTIFAKYIRNNIAGYKIVFHIFTPKDSLYHEYDENSISNELVGAIITN